MSVANLLKEGVRSLLHRTGFELVRSLDRGHLLKQAVRIMEEQQVGVVLDVGANTGQWAQTIRALGYGRHIVSFEPLSEAYLNLQARALQDEHWTTVNAALDREPGETVLHVSENSQSSSMLDMLPLHQEAAPRSSYVGSETVRVTTLERVAAERALHENTAFIKVDTQGCERRVLEGAGTALKTVVAMQVELSLVSLYEGEPLIEEMLMFLRGFGFVPSAFEPNFWVADTGRVLQVDGLFIRA